VIVFVDVFIVGTQLAVSLAFNKATGSHNPARRNPLRTNRQRTPLSGYPQRIRL